MATMYDAKAVRKFLGKPFASKDIQWRLGTVRGDQGLAFAYMDSRAVRDRLDDLIEADLGVSAWDNSFRVFTSGSVSGIISSITLTLDDGRTVTREDGASFTDFEPVKGGLSDAFKRAGSMFGIGRYLYDLPRKWVSVEMRGKTPVMAQIPKLPVWALPKGYLDENPNYLQESNPQVSNVGSSDSAPSAENGKHIINGQKHHGEAVEDLTGGRIS